MIIEKNEKEMAENVKDSENNVEEMKIEEVKNPTDSQVPEQKAKKKIIKRAPLEKTVDESLSEINKLLEAEVRLNNY